MEGFPIGIARRDLQNVVAGSVGGPRDAAAAIALPFDLDENARGAASGHGVQDTTCDLSRERAASRLRASCFLVVAIAVLDAGHIRHTSYDARILDEASRLSRESVCSLACGPAGEKQDSECQ